MRYFVLILIVLMIAGCASRVPTVHPPVTRTFELQERQQIIEQLAALLAVEKIRVVSKDVARGIVVTDSFDVPAEYCDCGKNLLGAEYPGKRRGMMRFEIGGKQTITMTIHFAPQLRISANNILVKCSSSGVLEEKLLTALEKKLGETSVH